MEVLIGVFGLLAGIIVGYLLAVTNPVGVLKIDHTDPEKDIYRFEIKNLDGLNNKKRIVLKVDNDAVLSQD